MEDRERLAQLPARLLAWYDASARVLPWRENPTPYRVWVSEIMLQQTRVEAVKPYYDRFLEAFPTVEDLAAAPEERVLKLWEGLGYYSRARNLQRAAQVVVERYQGQVPTSFEALRSLPGVGDYTAGAIASIAFGIPVPAVDGNVLRVAARITGDSGDITSPAMKKKVTAALQAVIPTGEPGNFNQAMMELGATVCLPNGAPLCEKCPAASFCRALREDRIGELPVKAPKKARRIEERRVYLIFSDDGVALRRRPGKGLLAGLWEYPNELAGEETIPAALGLSPADLELVGTGRHIFTHIEWHMTAYTVRAEALDLPQGWVWADREALAREYAAADPGLRMEMAACGASETPMDKASTEKAVCMLTCLPNGVQAMSMDIPGLVQTSLNLGILTTGAEELRACFSVRSSLGSQKEVLKDRLTCLTQALGGRSQYSGDYPAWEYKEDSPLRDRMVQVFREQYGRAPKVEAIHAGVECGLLAGKIPGLDCVSIGPDLLEIHTSRERMSISSVQRVWAFLLEVLKRSR